MVLIGKNILDNSIVTGIANRELQEQSCGVDLTVGKIESFMGPGTIDFDNSHREKPRLAEVTCIDGVWDLRSGPYLITFNETVAIPTEKMGLARPRSTMLRCGATIETAIWDPGYTGKSQCMMVIHNPHGLRVHKNARVLQLMILPLETMATKEYAGIYQKEGL